jgi:hypothetical protein
MPCSAYEKETHTKKIKELAESPIWQARTRGTAHHYHEFFPNEFFRVLKNPVLNKALKSLSLRSSSRGLEWQSGHP